MQAVRVHEGQAVPLDRSDVDTDQIIPSDWLKRVERTGFGKGLFSEWRDDRDFILNDELRWCINLGSRVQLWNGIVTRTCGLGAYGLRIHGRDLSPVRRHF